MAPPSRWSCTPYPFAAADVLARELELSPVTAAILTRRGHTTPEAARHFLAADERHDPLAHPHGLPGVHAACEAILRHVAAGSPIVVHGAINGVGFAVARAMSRAARAAPPQVPVSSTLLPSRSTEPVVDAHGAVT